MSYPFIYHFKYTGSIKIILFIIYKPKMSIKDTIIQQIESLLSNYNDYHIVIDSDNKKIKLKLKVSGKTKVKFSRKKFTDNDILSNNPDWLKKIEKSIKEIVVSHWLISASKSRDIEKIKEIKEKNINQRDHIKCTYKGLFNGMLFVGTESQVNNFKHTHKKINMKIEKDIKMKILGFPDKNLSPNLNQDKVGILSQSVGQFINRIGANKSSLKVGTGAPIGSLNPNVFVFVVDTGIYTHPELNVNTELSRNFINSNPADWQDQHGHGTHVSGIISAKDDSNGMVGVAPNSQTVAIRVLDANGSGWTSDIIAGLNYIGQWKTANPSKIGIVNMSLGGGFSTSLNNAVKSLIAKGVPVVVAAGNSGRDSKSYSPASVTEAITVGAYNSANNTLASWSNYGSVVDILAPGVNIYSTLLNDGYASWSGTSMATPVVVGTIVSMLKTNPTIISPSAIASKIINDAKLIRPVNYDTTLGSNPKIILIKTAKSAKTPDISVYAGKY
jgi:hypothetical protein